jgi:hypothetical protein
MKAVISAMVLAAYLVVATPATVHADEPVPTVDQVVAVLAELTDPNIPAANKTNVVTPGFSPDEAGTIDDHLNQMNAKGNRLPLNFVVTDIQPAPNNFAGATVATTGNIHQRSAPESIVLVDQGGHWLITHDTAMTALNEFYREATRFRDPGIK